jgi:hypothetical protein
MSLGDEKLDGLNGIVGEFSISKNVMSDIRTGTASIKVLQRK